MIGDLWDNLKRAIVPKSHAESLVDEIYGQNTRAPDVPKILETFDPEYGAWPAPVVKAKKAVTGAVDIVSGAFVRYAIIGIAVVIAVLLLHGYMVGRGIRK